MSQSKELISFNESNSSEISLIGKDVPSFYLLTLDNKDFFIKDLLNKDKFIFINFFATWCAPCIEELPDLQKIKNNNDNLDLVIIDVNNLGSVNKTTGEIQINKENVQNVSNVLKEIDAYKLFDNYTVVAEDFHILINKTVPQSFLVNSDGLIIWEKRKKLNNEDITTLNNLIGNLK